MTYRRLLPAIGFVALAFASADLVAAHYESSLALTPPPLTAPAVERAGPTVPPTGQVSRLLTSSHRHQMRIDTEEHIEEPLQSHPPGWTLLGTVADVEGNGVAFFHDGKGTRVLNSGQKLGESDFFLLDVHPQHVTLKGPDSTVRREIGEIPSSPPAKITAKETPKPRSVARNDSLTQSEIRHFTEHPEEIFQAGFKVSPRMEGEKITGMQGVLMLIRANICSGSRKSF